MSDIICNVCPHQCILKEGQTGYCTARAHPVNKSMKDVHRFGSISSNYGEVTSLALDPIEKKPLKNFMPGSFILSVGSWGCNMKCPWCQNDSISRGRCRHIVMTPEELLEKALESKNNIGIAYTYNEPLIGYEFVRDTAKLIKEAGLKNVLVSNGMASEEVFHEVLPYLDAMNIDLKTINAQKYRKIGGDLEAILNNIRTAKKTAHVELTTLIVPGFNDDEEEMKQLSATVAEIDPKIPLHVTRFFPAGEMWDAKPTPLETLFRMVDIAKQSLEYVYPGNV